MACASLDTFYHLFLCHSGLDLTVAAIAAIILKKDLVAPDPFNAGIR